MHPLLLLYIAGVLLNGYVLYSSFRRHEITGVALSTGCLTLLALAGIGIAIQNV